MEQAKVGFEIKAGLEQEIKGLRDDLRELQYKICETEERPGGPYGAAYKKLQDKLKAKEAELVTVCNRMRSNREPDRDPVAVVEAEYKQSAPNAAAKASLLATLKQLETLIVCVERYRAFCVYGDLVQEQGALTSLHYNLQRRLVNHPVMTPDEYRRRLNTAKAQVTQLRQQYAAVQEYLSESYPALAN